MCTSAVKSTRRPPPILPSLDKMQGAAFFFFTNFYYVWR